jgi:hypothetical protein
MAFEKRFKNDFVLIKNCEDFINALFNGDKPCDLLNSDATKTQFLKYFAGDEYESFSDFDRDIKITKKRFEKKQKQTDFVKEHNLKMYPHTAYSIFLNEKKADYTAKFPDVSPKELRSTMASDWSKMSDKEKEPFETIYNTKKQEFLDKVKSINPEFVSNFDKSQGPKAPLRPYTIFVKEQMKVIKEADPTIKSTTIMGEIGKKWKALGEEGKKKYYDMCNTDVPALPDKKVAPATVPDKKVAPATVPDKKVAPAKEDSTSAKPKTKGKSEPVEVKPKVQKKKTIIDDSSEVDEDEIQVHKMKGSSSESKNKKKLFGKIHQDAILNDDDDDEEE